MAVMIPVQTQAENWSPNPQDLSPKAGIEGHGISQPDTANYPPPLPTRGPPPPNSSLPRVYCMFMSYFCWLFSSFCVFLVRFFRFRIFLTNKYVRVLGNVSEGRIGVTWTHVGNFGLEHDEWPRRPTSNGQGHNLRLNLT